MFTVDSRDQLQCLVAELDIDPFTVRYLMRRLNREGVSFLTKTLPKLSKAVLHSLELGYFERPTDFSWHERSLRVFRSLLDSIFDHSSGVVLTNPDALAIYRLRTLCEYFYKLALPFSEEDLKSAEDAFVEEDASLERSSFDWEFIERLRRDFETHHSYHTDTSADVFKHQRPYLTQGTYSGKTKDVYYIHKTRPITVPHSYKADIGVFKPYPSAPMKLELGNDTANYSEVLFVPKDSRGPRTIVREPMANLAAQMSFHVWLRDNLNKQSRGRVNFVNQQINRDLARSSSITREFSTLDLKSASDRVACCVVKHITMNSPACRYFLRRRTKMAKLPSGRMLELKKVAGMGSGLTFPMMSLLIYLSACRAISDQRVPYKDAMNVVYVYGDDIIVPTRYVTHVTEALAKVGLKINSAKSFHLGNFRESCGGDYYGGQDVGPLRLRLAACDILVKQRKLFLSGASAILQIERHARECVRHGILKLAEYYYKLLEAKVGKLPEVSGGSSILGRFRLTPVPDPEPDGLGNYAKNKYLCALPVKKSVVDMNPYMFLGKRFSEDSAEIDPLAYLDKSCGSEYGELSVPRQVKYGRTVRSVLDLHVQIDS